MTDLLAALATSIERVGAPGDLAYTPRQLSYELGRTLQPAAQPPRWALLAAAPLALAAWARPGRAAGLAALGALLIGALTAWPRRSQPPQLWLPARQFDDLLRAYQARHGPPPGLLPTAAPAPRAPVAHEPDLTAYGLPRLLVCQSADLAAMLRANRLHLALSCAVLGLDEATPLPAPLRAMLERAPGARVYLLHDASPEGLALIPHLRARLDLPARLPITTLGLRPAQARRLRLPATHRPLPRPDPALWPPLPAADRAWLLAGWRVEVEAIRPASLARALRRALLGAPPPSRRPYRARTVGFMTWPAE